MLNKNGVRRKSFLELCSFRDIPGARGEVNIKVISDTYLIALAFSMLATLVIKAETRRKLELNFTIVALLVDLVLLDSEFMVISEHEGKTIAGFHRTFNALK